MLRPVSSSSATDRVCPQSRFLPSEAQGCPGSWRRKGGGRGGGEREERKMGVVRNGRGRGGEQDRDGRRERGGGEVGKE